MSVAKIGSFVLERCAPIKDQTRLVLETANRLGGVRLQESHAAAIVNSPSFNTSVVAAINASRNGLDIAPRTDMGPLSQLASLSIYDVMAAAFMVEEGRMVTPLAADLIGPLTQIEGVKKSGIISADLSGLITAATGTSMSFNSPTMVGLDVMAKIARQSGFGVPACNMNNWEMVEAAVAAAAFMRSPIILEFSPGSNKYNGGAVVASLMTRMIANKALAIGLPIPVCCHLDHGTVAAVKEAIAAKFNAVMIDPTEAGKKTNISYEDNVEITRELAELAHANGSTIEGEIGGKEGSFADLSGKSEEEALKYLTDPAMAVDFVKQTGVDALAVSIGTKHGGVKYKGDPLIYIDLLSRIRKALDAAGFEHVGLVLHGGSDASPFMDDLARLAGISYVNKPSGTPIIKQQEAIQAGVFKINLDTIYRLAQLYAALLMHGPMLDSLARTSTDDFRKFIGVPWRIALMNEVMRKLFELGAAGKAGLFLAGMDLSKYHSAASKSGANIE